MTAPALSANGGTFVSPDNGTVLLLGPNARPLFIAAGGTDGFRYSRGVAPWVDGGSATVNSSDVTWGIYAGGDAFVSGVALNLLVGGLTRFFLQLVFDSSSNSPQVAGLDSSIGYIVLALAALPVLALVLQRTRFGLRVRAVGEHPHAADTVGINVFRTRYMAVLISGLVAGLGGAWLAFDQHGFASGMSAGRGYIALAAMIRPSW